MINIGKEMKRTFDSMTVECKRPDPNAALEKWKLSQPSRPIGSGNKCTRDEFPDLFHNLLQWSEHSCISVYNSNRDFCGDIISSEYMDYYEIAGCLVEQWENKKEEFDEQDVPLLYCNGKFYKDRVGVTDSESFTDPESLLSLGLISEEFPEDSKCRDSAQVGTVKRFVDKLLAAWQTDGWLNTWKGIYMVFHQEGSSEVSRKLLPMDNSVDVSVGPYKIIGERQRLKKDSKGSSVFQCFIEFSDPQSYKN
jgi:hypothetical protein